jgi:membrane AbrB-like protein
MPSSVSLLRELMQVAETLLIAAVGGVGFNLIGFPGGLVSGSMLAVALAALAGRAVMVPLPLARLCFVLVGILLGAVVTPDTLKGIASWPLSVALLVVAAICMMTATACYLRLAHGWDPVSALLGASPGSMAQVMALSAEFGADVRGIAIVHVMLDRARPAGGTCVVRLDRGAHCLDAGRDRAFAHRACDPHIGIEPFCARHGVHQVSGWSPVRCDGRFWTTSRDGFDPCLAALVGRRRRRADAGRARGRKIRKYQS